MTAYSKAQKRAAKRGRPRLSREEREPNGKPSRRKASVHGRQRESMDAVMDVAVNRRIRQFAIQDVREKGGNVVTAEDQAKDPRHGYVLGRMLMDHAITKEQHDTGVRFGEDVARYYGLTGVAFPSARAQDLFAVRGEGGEGEGRKDAAGSASAKFRKMEAHLLAVQDITTGRRVLHTVMQVCVLDVAESRGWPPHMTSWLRLGLNALGKFYAGH